jgi:uncharacterized glyoxalase superfamily protein PhnB
MDEVESTIMPVLTVRHATEAVEFYQRAFGAQEIHRTPSVISGSLDDHSRARPATGQDAPARLSSDCLEP